MTGHHDRGRARRALGGGVAVLALLAAGVFGGVSLAKTPLGPLQATAGSTGTTGTTGTMPTQPSRKVTICHRTGSKKKPGNTITVSSSAVAAHLRHGDRLGPCTATTPTPTTTTTTTTTATTASSPGKSGDAPGKSGDKPGKSDEPHGNGNGNGGKPGKKP